MTQPRHTGVCTAALALTVITLLAAPAGHAQGAVAKPQSSGAAGAATAPRSVRFIPSPSHETPAARAKRLKRECKGRPNAGACLGHAR